MKIKVFALIGFLTILLMAGTACGKGGLDSYMRDRSAIQLAVNEYMEIHNGELPVWDVAGMQTYFGLNLIYMCDLVAYMDSQVPDSCSSPNGASCGCSGHYVWKLDDSGKVYSSCVGCPTNGDGYQGVYP